MGGMMVNIVSAAIGLFMLAALIYSVASLCGVKVPYISDWFDKH